MVNLAPQNLYGLEIAVPIIVAAGCWGYGAEYLRLAGTRTGVGAIVTSSTSLRPRRAASANIVETAAGLLWAGHYANPGIEAVLRRYSGFWAKSNVPIILSIIGDAPDDYLALAQGIEGVEGISGLEVVAANIDVLRLVRRLRAATDLPLLVRLPTHSEGNVELAQALAAAGADALVLPGYAPGLAVLPNGKQSKGWLCGPAVRPLALAELVAVVDKLEIPLIAGGGVTSAADVQSLLSLGACAVQIGSAALVDPSLPARVAADLSRNT